MLEGRVKENTSFEDIGKGEMKSDRKRNIDLVIFLLSEYDGPYGIFGDVLNIIKQKKVKYIFAVAKLDIIIPNFDGLNHTKCIRPVIDSKEYKQIRDKIQTSTGDEKLLYTVFNYRYDSELQYNRNINNEYSVYKLLEKGLEELNDRPVVVNPFLYDEIIILEEYK
eukprot:TRINITY_DN1682_c0_g1_i1.p1 TRINITY_DN1682_c0_g1~~TRINITY_DN1682_c0_g1_i1.p1  ORF type:complete len:166 (-),score=33.61 TRINITY_DN1682_c0_g1_i1:24-521(-)